MLQREFFIMSEKFHTCFAEKKWLLFMVKKIWGINFKSSCILIKSIKNGVGGEIIFVNISDHCQLLRMH